MVRDTLEALMDGLAGSETCDAPRWRDFAAWAWGRLDEGGQEWVRDALTYKQKPWPLAGV
jgi:hypothetical protein